MNHQTHYIPEIFCPYCFYSISITQLRDDNSKLIINCENCGQKEVNFDEFFSLMQKNTNKSCNLCCKNYSIKELYYSKKNKQFLCKQCYAFLLNNRKIRENEYINFKMTGKLCVEHNNNSNSLFCLTCQKHICSECKIKHDSHKIMKLFEEAKIKKNIEEMFSIIKKEEEDIKQLEKLGDIAINSISNQFGDKAKKRKEMHTFKKILYQYFCANSNSYVSYKNIDLIFQKENNPDIFINENELKELDKIINAIEINIKIKTKSNSKKREANNKAITIIKNNQSLDDPERRSLTVIKKSKKKSQRPPNLQNFKISKGASNINKIIKNNKLYSKIESKTPIKISKNKLSYYSSYTPIKSNRAKDKKSYEQSNILINQEINNKNTQFFYTGLNINLPNEKKVDNSLAILLKLDNSIMNMLLLETNKILISSFSPFKNLVLTELVKEKENNKYQLYMKILSSIKMEDKPIIHMELSENGNILACSDESIFIFKIVNNKINIQLIFPDNDEKNPLINNNNFHIISFVSLEENNLIILKNKEENGINHIISLRMNNITNSNKYSQNKIGIPKDYKAISIEKIASNICILIMQKKNNQNSTNNSNVLYLAFLKTVDGEFHYTNIREFKCKEKMNKLFIKKLLDNYIIISDSINSLAIYDYINNCIITSIKCDNVISIEIKDNGNEQIYLYSIEKKVTDENMNEELKIKKYFIKNLNKGNLLNNNLIKIKSLIDISCINNVNLSQKNKPNKINDMIVINDNDRDEKDNNGSEKNLVLLGDNEGNVFFKYY